MYIFFLFFWKRKLYLIDSPLFQRKYAELTERYDMYSEATSSHDIERERENVTKGKLFLCPPPIRWGDLDLPLSVRPSIRPFLRPSQKFVACISETTWATGKTFTGMFVRVCSCAPGVLLLDQFSNARVCGIVKYW